MVGGVGVGGMLVGRVHGVGGDLLPLASRTNHRPAKLRWREGVFVSCCLKRLRDLRFEMDMPPSTHCSPAKTPGLP